MGEFENLIGEVRRFKRVCQRHAARSDSRVVKPGWLARHEGRGTILDAVEYVLDAMVRYMATHACSPRELELYHTAKKAADEVKRRSC